MKDIDSHLKSCREDADVYTYSFTSLEVKQIKEALKKQSWIEEVRELLREQEGISNAK